VWLVRCCAVRCGVGAPGNRRVPLPLQDRSLRAFPHVYRMFGGDLAGWTSIGAKNVCFAPLYAKNDRFTKTGSWQT
jgi:hypothetical protein